MIWPFSKKISLLECGFFEGTTDWHCHILPGVDDGIRTTEYALEVLSYYEQTGIREVWLTPHIMEDVPNETGQLRARFAEFKTAYTGPIRLHLAAENMIDTLFDKRFEAGDLLTVGGGSEIPGPDGEFLLVETSYFNPPMAFEETLKAIRLRGLHPLLAHPERYVYMGRRDYTRLKESGIRFQLNLMSLAGMYGEQAAGNAHRLLLDGMYDFAGSDLHRLNPWKHAISEPVLSKKEIEALEALKERMEQRA